MHKRLVPFLLVSGLFCLPAFNALQADESKIPDWNAALYAKYATPQFQHGMCMMDELPLKGNETILDIGCGPGTLTKVLAQRVPKGKVIGIDASPSMIAYAKTLGIKNAEFYVMDATKIPYENAFDVAYSNAVFHWIDDQEALLKGIERALKPGGLLRAQFGGKSSTSSSAQTPAMQKVVAELAKKAPYRPYLKDVSSPVRARFSKEEYKAIVLRVPGFQEVEVWETPSANVFDTQEDLKGWVASLYTARYEGKLPENLRGPFLKDYLDGVMKLVEKRPDGKVVLQGQGQHVRINIRARKGQLGKGLP